MYVIKRSGLRENIKFDKVTARVRKLTDGLDLKYVDPIEVTMKVNQGIYSGVTTRELDNLAAETCAYMSINHPDYSVLAARICVSNLYKETESCYSTLVKQLRDYVNPETGEWAPLVSAELVKVVTENREQVQEALDGFAETYDYFAYKTLEKSYLLKMNGKIAERPHQLLMRVAIGIHGDDITSALQTYRDMGSKRYTMATPTLFNAGTPTPQMSSCFLMTCKDDSISGIFDTLKNCACISKYAGGLGVSIHDVRGRGSYIRGTNGVSNGLVPMLRVFNNTARYVDQGGGRRKGSIAIYLEPWHADIESFLDLKKNQGNELERARDLFYALWVPDLFMRRVEKNQKWSLMCPNECPGLANVWGKEFDALYEKYEASPNKVRATLDARKLWNHILDVQVETGTPYILYKDSVNAKSNQQHLGVIKSSNLCTEIVEYTSPDEIAVCNLASINLSSVIRHPYTAEAYVDYTALVGLAGSLVRNLNRVIDKNYYPVPEARASNMKHRPVGIGVQGFADALIMLRKPYDSPEAAAINVNLFESIYYGALKASLQEAQLYGRHESFPGSPLSQGRFQFDLWGVQPTDTYDWNTLRASIVEHGVRNSLLCAPMPTASTAQILGNNESFEPFTTNVYNRRVLAGEFPVVNKHLLKDLTSLDLWDDEMKNQLLLHNGSVQNIARIPRWVKDLYKTVWEIPQRVILDHAADRGPYVCQSQSMNIHMAEPTRAKLTSMLFHGWKRGLKTGMYYLRTRPRADSIQFGVDGAACTTCSA
ncbi:ribonucleotide reductase [Feldmannia irregularis virus a]|uniref:Ribonucleoside-diphosphate reductase n=1 Tax=Feldmannia irregularis virus a TaxID=231992 RepID=Q6XM67_9PHYC|nr:ribonucleotide reductase [Feldmannia irregularis virus a]AAR26844.1 FirrV-1-A20 [Feldmannia irregularis virus a]